MVASPLPTAEAKRIGSGGAIRTPPLSSCLIHRSAWKGYSPKFGPQGDLEVSGLVLRQPFFDRQYDPFRQHEVRWRCHQPNLGANFLELRKGEVRGRRLPRRWVARGLRTETLEPFSSRM